VQGALRKGLSRLRWSIVWDTFDVFVRDVEPGHADFVAPAGYTFRFGTEEDVRGFEERHTELGAVARERGARRLAIGHRVVVAQSAATAAPGAATAVFTMWINPRHLNVPGYVKRRLASDEVFIYKAFTSPDHRGKKLYQAGMRFVLADLARAGQRRLVGYAHVNKDVSRAGLDALGFRSVGTFTGRGFVRPYHVALSRELRAAFPHAVPRSGCDLT
jgi:ribosomal protein S18 acetylase RimI-like enzyme